MFAAIMKAMQRANALPKISDTERQALDAGDVWIDGEFFSGKPDFKTILAEPYASLSREEEEFLNGPVDQLLQMIDPYEVSQSRRIPDDALQFMRDKGFFGLIIPKEYGGLGFSALARSSVMAKVSAVNGLISSLVVLPNSIGGGELLLLNGTEEQKRHYLPKLARGELIPCFGLTEPTAGSDAASIKAEAEVFKDTDGEIKLRLNFRKRYITLAPIADLVSLACRVVDPDNLLGKGTDVGISVVVLEKTMPGMQMGDHHDPVGDIFYNGPITGRDVVCSVDQIIGGREKAGEGWRMLMEALAGGRVVSLPATAVGGAKAVAAVAGAYSVVREQFGVDIGSMEGIQAKLGHIAGMTYMLEAARVFACSAVDNHIEPPVVSAALKYASTEYSRELVRDAMDVFGGRGVMRGPSNVIANGYCSTPVPVTVEGANIMTRTLIVFGQGATRCHPHAMNAVDAAERSDAAGFRRSLLGWMGHFFANIGRSWARGLTRGWSAGSPVRDASATYYRRLAWSSSRFAMLTDLAMFFLGGKLKARGNLTGRYADVLTWTVLGTSALRRFEAEGRKEEDRALLDYALQRALAGIQEAYEGIYRNFDAPLIGGLLRTVGLLGLRLNPLGRMPADTLTGTCATALQTPDARFDRITRETFRALPTARGLGRLLAAFHLIADARPIVAKIVAAQKARKLSRGPVAAQIDAALESQVISEHEAKLLRSAEAARAEVIEVDVFTSEQYFAMARHSGIEISEDTEAAKAVA